MGYLVLARKYRPDRFDTVVGQAAVVRTLQNALRTGRIAHAYLFTGPRGVGKTSLARILARGLRCEQGPTPEPCGTCEACRRIGAGSDLDVVEIDGASNRGIENIRDLRESVRYAPSTGRTKVYIVDEVHQITQDAFNAFLKTLEEPPPHVVFIFATTEPAKVPETIRSRCQTFEFRRVPDAAIAAHVRSLCEQEGFGLEDGMDLEIARRARGGLRDALSLLDQLAAYGEGRVDFEAFRELTGFLAPDRIRELFDAVVQQDAASALDWAGRALDSGCTAGDLFDLMLDYARALLHRLTGSPRPPDLPGVDDASVASQLESLDEGIVLGLMQVLVRGRRDLREFEDTRMALEMVVLELTRVGALPKLTDVLARLPDAPQPRAGGGLPIRRSSPARASSSVTPLADAPPPPRVPEPLPSPNPSLSKATSITPPTDADAASALAVPASPAVSPEDARVTARMAAFDDLLPSDGGLDEPPWSEPEAPPKTPVAAAEESPPSFDEPASDSPHADIPSAEAPVAPLWHGDDSDWDLEHPPFPPELDLGRDKDDDDERSMRVFAPKELEPLDAEAVWPALKAMLEAEAPSQWAAVRDGDVVRTDAHRIELQLPPDARLDPERLDPLTRRWGRATVGREVLIRRARLLVEDEGANEAEELLRLVRDRFGGTTLES